MVVMLLLLLLMTMMMMMLMTLTMMMSFVSFMRISILAYTIYQGASSYSPNSLSECSLLGPSQLLLALAPLGPSYAVGSPLAKTRLSAAP